MALMGYCLDGSDLIWFTEVISADHNEQAYFSLTKKLGLIGRAVKERGANARVPATFFGL
jgi:hypothetical protein